MADDPLRIAVLSSPVDLFGRVVQAFCRSIRARTRCRFRLADASPETLEEARCWPADGVLCRMLPGLAGPLGASGLAAVGFGSFARPEATPWVSWDDAAVGRLAAEHLLERGHRRFGVTTQRTPHGDERTEAFREAVERAGFGVRVAEVPSRERGRGFSWARPEDAVTGLIDALESPAAVFATHDRLALQTAEACLELGRSVPDDVAVLGCDNDELVCTTAQPPLSSVVLPVEAIGERAAAVLLGLIRGEEVPRTTLLPPRRIVVRASTDAVGVTDATVRRAMGLVRSHAAEGLNVQQLCEAVGLSRRPLEKRFRVALGTTPLQQIHRARVDHARALLLETGLPVEEVARVTGFRDASRLGVVYRKLTGMTPTQQRQGPLGPAEPGG